MKCRRDENEKPAATIKQRGGTEQIKKPRKTGALGYPT